MLDGDRQVARLIGDDGEVVVGAGVPGIHADRSLQEAARHLRQTACPITLTTLFEINIHAFEINHIRCFSDDVGLED